MESVRKSNELSAVLRAEGNQFYARKDFYDALLKYNESLCRAESGSENLGLAYANRSAVYFEMKLHDECIVNIELAKQNRYPEKNYEIINRRHDKCVEMMKQPKLEAKANTEKISKLSYSAHEKLPFIADCLDLKSDSKYGRHIMTNQPLRVGDVIAIEEPFCLVIGAQFVYQKCAGCFGDFLLNLLPCPSCRKGELSGEVWC
jgi:SET and MYND domain-containing protein 4